MERQILELIGIDTFTFHGELLDIILDEFGPSFPSTRIFSRFARDLASDTDSVDDPDAALIRWLDSEEQLFRTLERHLVSEKLNEGFNDDVDEFISYSLGVQNRRKSRAGQAFENHLEQLFLDHQIQYARGKTTENKSRPDFIFPGKEAYENPSFPGAALTMLAAKTSCKDRWRQILTEANRISRKYLVTLEPGISEDQTNEMNDHSVDIVVPKILHDSFSPQQKESIIDVQTLIGILKVKQSRTSDARERMSGIF